ncbi:nucleoside phosphorylase [Nakamurella flavida]|uniref:Uridine phosphorylase n=1 Tax=Nakamurella flavida TaxID=363630 RepID=A0A939C1Y0_9ACTN|nr:nucleoside phosphorylase [Nakamurella flavida]MBM9475471.1 nucleoside phosphorylase [Nakamurella flavida]MDP9777021.1 uridine phosphorylase [Nakamurella flavida]
MSAPASPSPATPAPAGSSIVDKSAAGVGARQYHIGIAPGEVGTVALLPGDPFRVPFVAEFLTDVKDIAHNREHRTMTGMYRGRLITATSTGMGCPSTAIAVEELARVGVTSFIRVGSTAALQPGIRPGDLLVSEGSLRNDGTTAAYVHPGYPAVPDPTITLELAARSRALLAAEPGADWAVHSGLNASDDAFYAETPEWIGQLNAMGILNVEMESSAMYVVARLRGLRAGMICACSSNLVDGASLYDEANSRLKDGWMRSIEAALETAVALEL